MYTKDFVGLYNIIIKSSRSSTSIYIYNIIGGYYVFRVDLGLLRLGAYR